MSHKIKMIVNVGRCYELDDGRKARLKFIGDTKFAAGEWLGMEMIDGSEGKHDGVVKGKRYFKTTNRPPRGIFVRRKMVKVEIPDRKAKRMSYGPSNPKQRSPRRSRIATRIAQKKEKEERKNYDDGTIISDGKTKKLGPRQIGRVSNPNWKPAKFELNDTSNGKKSSGLGNPLSNVTIDKRAQRDTQHVVLMDGRRKKLGPREIGRMSGWKAAKYAEVDLKNDGAKGEHFLNKKRRYNTAISGIDKRAQLDTQHYVGNDGKLKKLGPRQIGRIEGWKPAKYQVSNDNASFLGKKRMYGGEGSELDVERRQQLDTQHYYMADGTKKKLGPRQIGRIEGWKPAKYEASHDTGGFLQRRGMSHVNPKKDAKGSPRLQTDTQTFITSDGRRKKLGPREIGRMDGWKAAKYEVSDTGAFLAKKRISLVGFGSDHNLIRQPVTDKRQSRDTQHFYDDHGRAKKLGPRQIGRIEGWKPAKYEASDTGKFLEKRGSSYVDPTGTDIRLPRDTQHFVDEHGRKKKLGPREIGRMSGWKGAQYDVPDDNGKFLDKRGNSYANLPEAVATDKRQQTDAGTMIVDGRVRKLGPRQIGTTKGYKPLKMEEESDDSDSLTPRKKRLSTSRHAQKQQASVVSKQTDSPTDAPKDSVPVDQQQQGSAEEPDDLNPSDNTGFPFSLLESAQGGSADANQLTLDDESSIEELLV